MGEVVEEHKVVGNVIPNFKQISSLMRPNFEDFIDYPTITRNTLITGCWYDKLDVYTIHDTAAKVVVE